jgi:hypothetical protein
VDYLSRYSRLARVPVPLLVVRWSQKYTVALLEALKPFLAKTSFANLRRVTESGLGALVYYYPSLPLRVSHAAPDKVADLTDTGISPERMGVSFAERLDTLRQRFEPSQTIQRWMNLLADMLFLGYFPFDTYYMGHCLQPQNLCIDGGCADTDSLVPMSTIPEERYFIELFLDASIWLAWSISQYLRGSLEENYANAVIMCCVWEDLHRLLRDRLARGEAGDPRLERIVKSEDFFVRLEFFLGNLLLGAVSPRKVGNRPTNEF